MIIVVVMPQTFLPRKNRRSGLSATDTLKPEEKDIRGVTCFMEENVISTCEVARFNGSDSIGGFCSSSIVSGMLCRPEVQKNTAILTAGRKCFLSHGVGSITLTVINRNPLKTNVLVVNSKPLGFDLLLGMDVIKKLGGVHINEGDKAHFAVAALALGATIELEQPDFRTEFDQHTKSW